jgi:hypothetical protein
MKKSLAYALFFSLVLSVTARDFKPLLNEETLPVLAAPDFTVPLDASFKASKGEWKPDGGEISVVNIPSEKHIPVLHHLVGLESAVIEVEFFFETPGSFLVGCDSDKHIGRVVINPAGMSIAEDSVKPSHTIQSVKLETKTGKWHQLRVEWKGDRMAANLDGEVIEAQHAFLGTAKMRSWLAAGDGVKIRNLKISGK